MVSSDLRIHSRALHGQGVYCAVINLWVFIRFVTFQLEQLVVLGRYKYDCTADVGLDFMFFYRRNQRLLSKRLRAIGGKVLQLLKGWNFLVRKLMWLDIHIYEQWQFAPLPWPSYAINISGVKLSDASKKLGKKFATGASVVKVLFFGNMTYLLSFDSMIINHMVCMISGTNWKGANRCSGWHIFWRCGLHYRDLARCNIYQN